MEAQLSAAKAKLEAHLSSLGRDEPTSSPEPEQARKPGSISASA